MRTHRMVGVWLVALLCSVSVGCGGAGGSAGAQTGPFTDELAVVFDDGVDFITTANSLSGRWREDWDRDLKLRVDSADSVAIVSIETMRTDTDPEGNETHRLIALLEREITGTFGDEEVALTTTTASKGYPSVHNNARRLQSGRFLAFIRWYTDAEGVRRAHWHLSPDADEVVSAAEKLVSNTLTEEAGGGSSRTVTIQQTYD